MNGKEKPKSPPPEPKEGVIVVPKGSKVDLTPKELREDTREGLKEDPAKPEKEPKAKEERKIEVTREEFMAFAALSDKLVRIERMLEYLVIGQVTDNQKILPEPNIRDILAEIAAGAKGKIKVPPKEKKDEVPTDS